MVRTGSTSRANIRNNGDDSPLIPETWTKNFGSVKVGFVGAVTEHLPELVSPAGSPTIHVTDIVNEVNTAADDLKADGADVVVMLVHEGAPTPTAPRWTTTRTSDFGSIITGVNDNVDAIVSRPHPPGVRLLTSRCPAGRVVR